MKLESEKTTVDKPQKTCFEFLAQPGNYKKLMPENTVKFELLEVGGFLFQLKGMPEIALKVADKQPNDKIVLDAAGGKFDFGLVVQIEQIEAGESQVQFLFEGDFNPMMAMMVKKPLKNFINTLSGNLSEIQ